MRLSIMKRFSIAVAHRLYKHEDKCKNIHGHNYKIEVHLEAEKLDHVGRIVDFTEVKDSIGQWLNNNWDHATIINKEDEEVLNMFIKSNMKYYVMDTNPTAENMATWLLKEVCNTQIKPNVKVTKIRVWETDTSYAEASV